MEILWKTGAGRFKKVEEQYGDKGGGIERDT